MIHDFEMLFGIIVFVLFVLAVPAILLYVAVSYFNGPSSSTPTSIFDDATTDLPKSEVKGD